MKKNSFIFLIIVALFTCAGQTFAASIGDSITPVGRHKVTFSLEDNSIFQRQITKSGTLTEFSMNNTNQVYGKLTFGLSDNINLYGKIGESDGGKLQLSYSDTGSTTVYAKPGFFSGVGVSGSADVYEGLRVGLDMQYGFWQMTPSKIVESGERANGVAGTILDQEFQLALFTTKTFSFPDNGLKFSPYVAGVFTYFNTRTEKNLTYSTATYDYNLSWSEQNRSKIGLICGADFFLPQYLIQLNIEGRLLDENGLSAGLTYRY